MTLSCGKSASLKCDNSLSRRRLLYFAAPFNNWEINREFSILAKTTWCYLLLLIYKDCMSMWLFVVLCTLFEYMSAVNMFSHWAKTTWCLTLAGALADDDKQPFYRAAVLCTLFKHVFSVGYARWRLTLTLWQGALAHQQAMTFCKTVIHTLHSLSAVFCDKQLFNNSGLCSWWQVQGGQWLLHRWCPHWQPMSASMCILLDSTILSTVSLLLSTKLPVHSILTTLI